MGVEGGKDRTKEPFLHDVHSVQKPGELALAVSVENNRLVINFGTQVDWISLDRPHLDIFIALLTEKGKDLR